MIFGFNTDVPVESGIYHVQTEDRGSKRAIVESIVYVGGKILGRVRTPYENSQVTQEQIEEMVRHQHRELVEAIRAGSWEPKGESAETKPTKALQGYDIQLLNSDNVRHGEFLRFQLAVQDRSEKVPAGGVTLEVRWVLGGEVAEKQSLTSKADGEAEFWLPRPADHMYATLLISAAGPAGRQLAKFIVRGYD